MTKLSAAVVPEEVIAAVSEALRHFFDLDELQAAAGQVIAQASGAESGFVTACTSAGITLSVAASMTGTDLGRVHQLPDTSGMRRRVVIQKGHCVDYGAPITQAIRLAGARPVEIGTVSRCHAQHLRHALSTGDAAAVIAVESHHAVQHGQLPLQDVVEIAHGFGVPVIVDGAAQDLRLRELVATGADLVITSAHKFLCAPTAGVVAGRHSLIEAAYLQNQGVGRGMKAGKEAIIGAMAALELRERTGIPEWQAEQDRKVRLILKRLEAAPGLHLGVDPDPNGNPFSRARITPDGGARRAAALVAGLAAGDPTIVARAHHVDEGYFYLDAIEMTDEQIEFVCGRLIELAKGA